MSNEKGNEKTRAAVVVEPLPQAGESVRRRRDDFYDKMLYWGMVGFLLLYLAVYEWLRVAFGWMPTVSGAIINSLLTAIVLVVAFVKARRAWREMRALEKGLIGEKHVGHYLDDVCRGIGYRVLHDVPGEGFNVDHVLVGPGGVFSLETKYRSKPAGEKAEVVFDGKRLTWPDGRWDEEIVRQAKANADFVRKEIEKRLGRRVYVFPVVVMPGWYIVNRAPRPWAVWVMADEGLHQFLQVEEERLEREEECSVYEALAGYVRNKGK
jgi:hypothetical protein